MIDHTTSPITMHDTRRGTPMSLIDQPWSRVRNPVPIPAKDTADTLRALSDVEFAEMLRCHLNPIDQDPKTRARWNLLWTAVRNDEALTDRAYDILEEFQNQTEDALAGDELDDAGRKRAAKFLRACEATWQRIDREPPGDPLDWAGKAGRFPAPANKVIAVLVSQIAAHRTAVRNSPNGPAPHDEHLHATLHRLGLDPDDYPTLPEH